MTISQKTIVLAIGLSLVPILVFVFWRSSHKAARVQVNRMRARFSAIQALDQDLKGEPQTTKDPLTIAHRWVQTQVSRVNIVEWTQRVSQPVNDQKRVSGIAIDDNGHRYEYSVKLTADNEIVPSQSSLWEASGNIDDSPKNAEVEEVELLSVRKSVDDYDTFSYNLAEGSVLNVRVKSNAPVNVFLVDTRNLNLFEDEHDFTWHEGSEAVTRFSVSFVVPSTRDWHLIVENENDQTAVVDIRLTLLEGPS